MMRRLLSASALSAIFVGFLLFSLYAFAAEKLVATISGDDFEVGGDGFVVVTGFDTNESITGIGITGLWSAVVADQENGTAPWALDLAVAVTAPDGNQFSWGPIGGDVTIAAYPLQDFTAGFDGVAGDGDFTWSFTSAGPPWVAGMSDVSFHLTTEVPDVQQVFEGSVAEGSLWNRPYFIAGVSGQGPVFYQAMEFEVSVSGGYEIESVVAEGNNFAYIYQGGFDPEKPLENLLDYGLGNGFSWDGSPQGTSRISAMLFEDTTYHLVVSQWSPTAPGQSYVNTVTGPGEFVVAGGEPAEPAISLDPEEIVEYWFWAAGVEVSGSGFAGDSEVSVVVTDPEGGTREFTALSDAAGTFSTQVNAMKRRSVLGEYVISAADAEDNAASALLSVIRDPDEVLEVSVDPGELTLADFEASGVLVHITGLVPNGQLKINLADPADNVGELMTSSFLQADENGEFEFVLTPDTEIAGFGIGAVLPTEGRWGVSVHDFSGENSHHGEGLFRMLPDNPGTDAYCDVDMTNAVEPITLVRFAGIDNPSPVDSEMGYEDFTAIEGQVTPGETYTIVMQGRAQWNFHVNTYTVFIDWNRNGILDEAGEVYSAGYLLGSTGEDGMQVEYEITVPEDALAGPTRMRVLKVWSPSPTAMYWPDGACGNYRWGQVEDYTLWIEGDVDPEPGELQASPDELDLGAVTVGNVSTASFTVLNAGPPDAADIELSAIAVTDGDPAFGIAGTDCASTLAPGQSCTVEVEFAPDTAASHTGTVNVSTADGQSASVALTGAGSEPPEPEDAIFSDRFQQ